MISATDLATAFPNVTPGVHPLGSRVLVQLRTVRSKTDSGLFLPQQTKDFNKSVAQIAKVVELGPLAYRNRNSMDRWPEGAWCEVGGYVRVPRYGGDRVEKAIPGTDETAIFVIVQDHEIICTVDTDVLAEIDELL